MIRPSTSQDVDRFGNKMDPTVGYARGTILASSLEESKRQAHTQHLIRARQDTYGVDSLAIFTGNQRELPLYPDDLDSLTEEWTGPARFSGELANRIIEHLGGRPKHRTAVFNRTSAGIVATINSIEREGIVLAYAAKPGRSHVSVFRGAKLASRAVAEVGDLDQLAAALSNERTTLAVITSVTSELHSLDAADIQRATSLAQAQGVPVLLDDAYGARLRTVAFSGPRALELGVDMAISNSDKAGLQGPRAGFMAGEPYYVELALSRASELGLEARAPIALGVLRALEKWDPSVLVEELDIAAKLSEQLGGLLGEDRVVATTLGPLVAPDDILDIACYRARLEPRDVKVVPAEAATALGMLLLRDEGILTVNAAGTPGARVSLRLKPIPGALARVGGLEAAILAVDRSLTQLANLIRDENEIGALILGPG